MNEPIDITAAAKIREKFETVPMCSLMLEDHEFVHVKFNDTIVAVLCSVCAYYPLEVLGQWETGVGEFLN
jgi:hypothetical protein